MNNLLEELLLVSILGDIFCKFKVRGTLKKRTKNQDMPIRYRKKEDLQNFSFPFGKNKETIGKIKLWYNNLSGIFFINNKGSFVVSQLVAAFIMGISGVALVAYMQGQSRQTHEVEQEQDLSFNIHSNIISDLRALLVEANIDNTGEKQAQSKEGVCSFLEPPTKMAGVELIQFNIGSNLSAEARASFSESRWEAFFDKSEYELSSDDTPCEAMDPDFTDSLFSRCFKYIGKQNETANEVYVIARIIPKKFPEQTDIDLSQSNTLDAKAVLFELQSLVSVFKGDDYDEKGLYVSKQYSLIWANAVSECHAESANSARTVAVQFSGSGTGRLSRKTIINTPEYDASACSELEFQDITPEMRMSHSIDSDGNVGVDSIRARTACRRNVFRCKGESSDSSKDYEPVIFTMGLSNDSGGPFDLKKVGLTFKDESNVEVASGSPGKLTVEVYNEVWDFDANKVFKKNHPAAILNPGHAVYKFTLKDKSDGDNSLKGFCDDVCDSGKKIFPFVTMDLYKAPGATCTSYSSEYEKEEKNRFRCIVCHSKICTKIGMGTFGTIEDELDKDGNLLVQGLVDEPLDGTLPECALPKNNSGGKYDLPDFKSSSSVGGSGDCIAIKLPNLESFKSFDSAQYEFKNCSNSLPILCFASGHYVPAVDLSSPTSKPAIFTGSFNKAQEACYKMGREIVKKTDLAGFFMYFWLTISGDVDSVAGGLGLPSFSDANYFDYVNNATRGIFIAPSYKIEELSNFLKEGEGYLKKFTDGGHTSAWVAMRKDGGGQVIGSIPWAKVADSKVAIFRRKALLSTDPPTRPSPILLKNTYSVPSSDTDTILTHNIQYKGVYNLPGGSGITGKALCRKGPGDFVLSSSAVRVQQAPGACTAKGAKFLPPLSSLEWAKAMTLINPNDESYPFPDPGDLSSGTNHIFSINIPATGAWVALSKSTGKDGKNTENWRLSDAYFPDAKSLFNADNVDEPMPDKGSDYIGVVDYEGTPVVPTNLTISNVRDRSFINTYKKICYEAHDNDQVSLKPPAGVNGACGSGVDATDEGFIDEKRKSVKFMTEWVEEHTSGEFVINMQAIDELQQRAEHLYCEKVGDGECRACEADCDAKAAQCVDACPEDCCTTSNSCTVPGDLSSCTSTTTCSKCPACLQACENEKIRCKNECRTCGGTVYPSCDDEGFCECKWPFEAWTPSVLPDGAPL